MERATEWVRDWPVRAVNNLQAFNCRAHESLCGPEAKWFEQDDNAKNEA
jgi:hypothetical protein